MSDRPQAAIPGSPANLRVENDVWAPRERRRKSERVTGFAASLFRRNGVAGGACGVPRRRRFRAAGKSVEIDTYKSPTLAIACRPFEIVQEGPGVVAPNSAAFTNRLVQGPKMLIKKADTGWVGGRLIAIGCGQAPSGRTGSPSAR